MRNEFERLNYKLKASELKKEQDFVNQYKIPVVFPNDYFDEKGNELDGQEFSDERTSAFESR